MALPTASPGPATLTAANTGNLTTSGVYSYAVTFAGNYGESGLGTPATVTLAGSQAQVALSAIPTGPTGTTARNIYRTKSGGSTFFYCGSVPDNTTTTFTDNTADTGLGGAPSQFFVAQGDIQGAFLMFDDQALAANAGYGALNIGPGPWDGASTGFFAGSAAGTGIAMNLPAGHTGNFFDFQAAGVSLVSATIDGLLKCTSAVASHFGGIATSVKAGIPADADFSAAPPNGTIVIDSTDGRAYFRYGGAWHYATLT